MTGKVTDATRKYSVVTGKPNDMTRNPPAYLPATTKKPDIRSAVIRLILAILF